MKGQGHRVDYRLRTGRTSGDRGISKKRENFLGQEGQILKSIALSTISAAGRK